MKKWFVKEFGKIANISVKTLHYYDSTKLLVPSERTVSGYRMYNQADLQRLQQIIALKMLGFELKSVKLLLEKKINPIIHLKKQAAILQKKADLFNKLGASLQCFVQKQNFDTDISWTQIVDLIKEYQMTDEKCKNLTWAAESEMQMAFEQELLAQKICSKDDICNARKNFMNLSTQQKESLQNHESWAKELVALQKKGFSPSSTEVLSLIQKHFEMISIFWQPTKESYIGLADSYLQLGTAGEFYEKIFPGLSKFLAEGMKVFAMRKL